VNTALKSILLIAGAFVLVALLPETGFAFEIEHEIVAPNPWMIVPFVTLLLAIALMPFIEPHWWERYFPHVAVGLGLVTIVYYVFVLSNPLRMAATAIEYFSFMCLIGSLFVVAGGLLIEFRGYASPLKNVLILLFGVIISNLIGTTGASVVLIRPYMRNNRHRLHAYHIVFFIFLVSNIGGALTPIGDPPLFLGYLKGVPFFWVIENVWPIWMLAVGIVLAVFLVIDWRNYRKLPAELKQAENKLDDRLVFKGWYNLLYLAMILVAVFIQHPPFLREGLMIAAAAGSLLTTRKAIHVANSFNFAPIREVAFLFLGIFATMVPALDWLSLNAGSLGITTPGAYFWGSGILSSFLDNAPTYLNFLSASIGSFVKPETVADITRILASGPLGDLSAYAHEIRIIVQTLARYHGDLVATGHVPIDDIQISAIIGLHPIYLMAISMGSVFFGANTYIGNAPNFMVKSIAEQHGVAMPSFLGYIGRYSLPVLIPVFAVIWLIFF
jgi:Na+/H+ antiporter NhaD/arsenite permease-like protein